MWWRTLFLRRFSKPTPKTTLSPSSIHDFTQQTPAHWAGFDGGDNFAARFTIKAPVKTGDDILVKLRSGRIGKYHLYSVRSTFDEHGGIFKCLGCAIQYKEKHDLALAETKIAAPTNKAVRGPRPSNDGVSDVSSGVVVRPCEYWKVLARIEATNRGSDSMRP